MNADSGAPTALSVRASILPPAPIAPPSAKRLSESLWDIDYDAYFPLAVSEDGITVQVVGVDDALEFVGDHYGALFGEANDSPFWSGDSPSARERYLRHACDLFLFKDGHLPVGLFIGNPVDWSTYYIRSTAFLAKYQGRSVYQRFLAQLFALLTDAGVSRVEADTAPSNLQCVAALMRQRFVVTGSVLSERWGALTRFTRHLHPEAECTFLKQFCASGAIHHQQNHRPRLDATVNHTRKGVTQ